MNGVPELRRDAEGAVGGRPTPCIDRASRFPPATATPMSAGGMTGADRADRLRLAGLAGHPDPAVRALGSAAASRRIAERPVIFHTQYTSCAAFGFA